MNKSLSSPPDLGLFLNHLHEKFGKFIILRGYDFLPNSYTNDIDVYVPIKDLARFVDCINNLDGIESNLEILISRFGLMKCELVLNGVVIPFDILYGFYYAGLKYQDCDQLFSNSKMHSCGLFSIPDISDEVRISLLKELLHNGRVRSDKASYLLKNMDKCAGDIPTDYFDTETINVVRDAIVSASYYLPKVPQAIKVKLLVHNLRKNCAQTVKNMFMFVAVKYVLKNEYHKRITRL